MSELEQILNEISTGESLRNSRRDWNPSHVGEIDIRIAADGDWYHQGRKFQRDSMVKLFAGILRREQTNYYLVTPAEKLRIVVDDAPFVATLTERIDSGGQSAILFTTNIGERILLDAAHPLRIEIDQTSGTPRPYVLVQAGLEALISRSAFYDLIGYAEERSADGANYLVVTSMGQEFELGRSDE